MFPTSLSFLAICILCYARCMYMSMFMYLKCGCHGICVKVGGEPRVLVFPFYLVWDSLLIAYYCIFTLTGSQAFGSSLVSVSHLAIGELGLQLCPTFYGFLVFKFRSSCWCCRCFTLPALHYMSFEDKCVSCLYCIGKARMIAYYDY